LSAKSGKNWFSKKENKDKVNERRRERYANDPAYRERAKKQAAEYRREHAKGREAPPEGYSLTAAQVAEGLGVSAATLRAWREKGYYPAPKEVGGRLWFTQAQAARLGALRDELAKLPRRRPLRADQQAALDGAVKAAGAGWQAA